MIDVEVYNNVKRLYELFEAIVDTGATFCAIGKHVSDKMGLTQAGKLHLWQVDSPLISSRAILRIRYRKGEHNVEGVVVDISEGYLRSATANEICKRPLAPHPLMSRIILGKSFLDRLTEIQRREIFARLS